MVAPREGGALGLPSTVERMAQLAIGGAGFQRCVGVTVRERYKTFQVATVVKVQSVELDDAVLKVSISSQLPHHREGTHRQRPKMSANY